MVAVAAEPLPRFAATKIQPPRPRPGTLIDRPWLEQRLGDALLQQRLVLVSAAAGFGKTTALARQVQRLPAGTAVAWVSCDEGDTPAQLLACLVAALEPFDPPWRVAPETLIESASRPGLDAAARRALATEVVNALAACELPHGVIVVDDLHRIDRPEVHEFVDAVVERLAPHWTFCIATRGDPPLKLARLRALGQLAEFRLAELRFEPDEARALLAQAGIEPAAAEALVERTQGWPVGLRLAINVLSGAAGARTLAAAHWTIDRHVFDFLASEVLDRQDPALRQFLLRCAVLVELNAARCAAVSGDPRAAERLEQIERAGLFVSVIGGGEPTLRLHDLFREALERRLVRDHPDELPALLRRAAAGEPDPLRQVALLVRAEAWQQAAATLREHTPALLTHGIVHDVARAIEAFPPAQREALPDLQLAAALVGWAQWNWAGMLAAAGRAITGFAAAGRSADARQARTYRIIALRGGGQRGDSDSALAELQRELAAGDPGDAETRVLISLVPVWIAFDAARFAELPQLLAAQFALLEQDCAAPLWYQCVPLPVYVGLPGTAAPLRRYVDGVLARTQEGPGELRMLARGLQGSLRVWAGDLAGGVRALEDVAGEVRWRDFPLRATLHTHVTLALAQALRGDGAGFDRDLQTLIDTLARWGTESGIAPRLGTEYYIAARWLLCAGRAERARELFERLRGMADPRERPVFRVQREPLEGYLAWISGDHAGAAAAFLRCVRQHGEALELLGQASELRLRAAWALCGRDDPAGAAAALQPLWERHAGDTDIAAVWIAGPALLQDLARARWGPALAAAERATLQRWAAQAAALRGGPAGAVDAATAPVAQVTGGQPAGAAIGELSERETEVLQLIAAGHSNKLIARALDLSPHTVKRHVANILDKLALASRGQAAAWLRDRR